MNVDVENVVDMSEIEFNEPNEVAPPKPLVKPLMRRSVRERHLS